MRTVTGPEATVLAARQSKHYLRTEIKNAAGTWIDYSALAGIDWQDRVEIRCDVNQRVAQATVHLAREADGNSLSPLMNTEIDVGRAIRISGARVAVGATPVAGDYKPLFLGRVRSWAEHADPMVLVALDDSSLLVRRWVEEETEYGGPAEDIEDVMQEILDDWADAAALYVPVSPGFVVTAYTQQRQSVLEALQALADLIGWVIEYRWDNGTGAFRYTFYEPDRTPAATAWTFGPDDYYDVTRLELSDEDIRNAISGRYTDSATGARAVYTASDAASTAKYGRIWSEFEEANDSPIDTDAEMQTMVEAALSDLAAPVADQEVSVDLFWPIQLGDFYKFLANGVHYGADQEFAAVGYAHIFEAGAGTTLLQTRGTPVGHTKGWIQREKRRPPEDTVPRLTNFSVGFQDDGTVVLSWAGNANFTEAYVNVGINQVFATAEPGVPTAATNQGHLAGPAGVLVLDGTGTTDLRVAAVGEASWAKAVCAGSAIEYDAARRRGDTEFVPPQVRATATRSATTIVLALYITDPSRSITGNTKIVWQKREGAGALTGESSTWTSSTNNAPNTALMTRTLDVTAADGLDGEIRYRVYFLDELGVERSKGDVIYFSTLRQISKTIRYQPSAFLPEIDTATWAFGASGAYLYPNALAQVDFYAPVDLPTGVTVTEVTQRSMRTDAGDAVVLRLRDVDTSAGVGTVVTVTQDVTGAAYADKVGAASQLLAVDRWYYLQLTLLSDGVASHARFVGAEVDYDTPSYDKTV